MKQELILESLSKLNPDDDSHWTQDGSPRLGAVGEGVTRQDILAIAPLFNRKNPELPFDDSPSPEEKAETLKQKKLDIEGKVKAAILAMHDAKHALEAANAEMAELALEEKKLDPRTDTEINQEFLRKDWERNLEKAEQRKQALELLKMAGVSGRDIHLYSLGVADRAIAEANIRKRKEALKGR
jgi:hypothetical protein